MTHSPPQWYNTITSAEGSFFSANFQKRNVLAAPRLGERPPEGGTIKTKIRRCRSTMRVKVTLACSECKQRNYDTKKNKKNDPDRLEMNKYCRFCRKHTLHKETK